MLKKTGFQKWRPVFLTIDQFYGTISYERYYEWETK